MHRADEMSYRLDQTRKRLRVRITIPTDEVEHLCLPEPERRLHLVEAERYQLVFLARLLRFVANPLRGKRVGRPQHDHDFCRGQLTFDLGNELDAAVNVPVPPD